MLATTASFLATVAAQVGSAFYNNARGKAQGKELARKQLAFEEKVAREGIENARAEFAELCSFQRELEAEIQRDRLKLLNESLQTSLTLEAYELSLNSWPLLVPPYVITNNSVFSLENSENNAIPLNCILTPSTDGNFNKIYVKVEENLADFCSKYWNVSSNKSIRFLQETWRDSLSDADTKRQNLYAHLKNVPTLVISPIIRDEKLIFRIYWWGLSPDANEVHIDGSDEFDPAISISVTRAKKYTQEEISEITEQCTAKLSAFISYFADLYYWNFYKEAPYLPTLLVNRDIELKGAESSDYVKSYVHLISDHLNDEQTINISAELNYLESISEAIQPHEFKKVVEKVTKLIKLIPVLQAKDIIRVSEFSHDFGSSPMSDIVDKHLSAQIEEIEIIDELNSISDDTIVSFVNENSLDAINAKKFAFINWSKNMYIGTFCDIDETPCIYSSSNTVRFFVFRNTNYSSSEPEQKNHIFNIIPLDMNSNDNKPSGRESLGRRLINIGNRLCNDSRGLHSTQQNSPSNNAWGDVQNNRSFDLSTIINFFINGVNNNTIHYTQGGVNLGLSDILNWLDNLSDYQIGNANQVYIIRGEYKAKNRFIYCAFLANNDRFDLESTTKECFICEAESEEMKDAFSGKLIYVIPFEN